MAHENTIDYYLKSAWQSVMNAYNQEASKHDFTQTFGYVMINIKKEGTAVSQIASLLGVRSTSLSRVLSSMEKQGLIYRAADLTDKRSVKVYLTPFGLEKRSAAAHIVKDFNSFLEDHITDNERKRLAEALQKINKLAQQYALENK